MAPTAAAARDGDVLRVKGTVKLAYPLRPTRQQHAADDTFTLGDGPCGDDATQVMTLVLDNESSYESSVVFFYDIWAERASFLQRHYKVVVEGLGLATLLWDVGSEETEDRRSCYVVAERHVLKRALERRARIFELPPGLSIEIAYEEAQRVPGVDQLCYLAPKTIHTRDLRPDPKKATVQPPPLVLQASRPNARGKRTLQQAAGAYTYTCLGDLVCGKASIYGVVVNLTLPKKTRGTDYSMTVHVVDESCPERRHAIQIVIFYPTIKQMPRVLFVGDIIRFHRLEVKRYMDNLQGVSYPKYTRHLVIRENEQTGELEQKTCSESWTFDESDCERVRELLKWSKEGLRTDTTFPPGYPQPPNLLADTIVPGSFVDLVVRVLFVDHGHFTRKTRVVVWDGSGSAELSATSCTALLRQNGVETPAHGYLKEITFDSCWVLLQEFEFTDKLLSHWCRFRNLAVVEGTESAEDYAGYLFSATLQFREGASLMFVPEYVRDVQARLEIAIHASDLSSVPEQQDDDDGKQHEQQQQSTMSPSPSDAEQQVRTLVPEYIRNGVPVTTLLQVQNNAVVPRKYHCLARFATIWPTDIAKITKLQPGGAGDTYIYSFVVRLEDDSGSIDAIVYGKDAEHFLQGIPPCNLHTSTSSRTVLEKKVSALVNSLQRLHCCIKSYYPPSAGSSSDKKSVRYRLFDTLLQ